MCPLRSEGDTTTHLLIISLLAKHYDTPIP